jgi:hypothetical protein
MAEQRPQALLRYSPALDGKRKGNCAGRRRARDLAL